MRRSAQLAGAGATLVTYVPNDAWLVRMPDAGAQALAAQGLFVTPYEPYFKVEASLLSLALGQASRPRRPAWRSSSWCSPTRRLARPRPCSNRA